MSFRVPKLRQDDYLKRSDYYIKKIIKNIIPS